MTDITVRALARELGMDRRKLKDYVKNHRPPLGRTPTGRGAGQSITLTFDEAETLRRELVGRLKLPEPADVARETGQPVYLVNEAAKALSLDRHTVSKYIADLGIGIQIRNGIAPSFVVTADGLRMIWEAAEASKERMKQMLRDQAEHANKIGNRRKQHTALMREETDYYGRVVAWEMGPAVCVDASSDIPGGPETCTMQWLPFYPSTKPNESLDLSVWNVSDHRQHLSLERMLDDDGDRHNRYFTKRLQ